jgi:hypothetical protein
MSADEIREGMKLLRNYYAKDGQPRMLNDAQWAVYVAGLTPYTRADLERAAHRWMQTSQFFPLLSDLLTLIKPAVSALVRQQREEIEAHNRKLIAAGDRPVDPAKLANFKHDVAEFLRRRSMGSR